MVYTALRSGKRVYIIRRLSLTDIRSSQTSSLRSTLSTSQTGTTNFRRASGSCPFIPLHIFQWRKIKTKSTNSTQWRLLKYLFRTFLVQLLDAVGSRGCRSLSELALGSYLGWMGGGWYITLGLKVYEVPSTVYFRDINVAPLPLFIQFLLHNSMNKTH